jgi:hypothetical protein
MNYAALQLAAHFHIDVSTVTATTAICRPYGLLLVFELHSGFHPMTFCTKRGSSFSPKSQRRGAKDVTPGATGSNRSRDSYLLAGFW